MPREPKPWHWKARKAWYAQINGKHVKLSEISKADALQELYRIKAATGKLDQPHKDAVTVTDACEAMLASSQHFRPATLRIYNEKLGAFAGKFGGRRLDSLTPAEVMKWVGDYQGARPDIKPYGEPSRSLLFRYIKTLYRWCRNTGFIQIDLFSRVANPWRIMARTEPMKPEDYELVMSLSRLSSEFKELVEFIWRTGIRPDELVKLAARHLDARLMIARFQPAEHKTGTKTGLQREVHIPADLWDRLQAYALVHKQGPLLRKHNGNPWTSKELSEKWHKLKVRHGLKCVLYQARHAMLTNLLDSGEALHLVAKIAGHTKTDVLMQTYYHPDTEKMADAVNASSDAESARMADIEARVKARRAEAKDRKRALATEWMRKKRAVIKNEASDT